LDLTAEFYPNGNHGIGTLGSLNLDVVNSQYYIPTVIDCVDVPNQDLSNLFDLEHVPVFCDEGLAWSGNLTLS
jgi:hypothetical protein